MRRTVLSKCVLASCVAIGVATTGEAAVYMFDFGLTTTTGAAQTNSPYHTVNGSFSDTAWNKLEITDVASGIVTSAGGATALSVNLGRASASTIISLSGSPDLSQAGSGSLTGVYSTPSAGRDFIGYNTSNSRTGLQLTGLTPGIYDLYLVGRQTNSTEVNAYTQTFFVGQSAAGTSFDYAAYSNATINYDKTVNLASAAWVDGTSGTVLGENYVKLTITLTTGNAMNIAVAGAGGDTRGFVNSIQIVAVPEPTVFALAGLLLPLACRRRV